jgi:hypothetical protein
MYIYIPLFIKVYRVTDTPPRAVTVESAFKAAAKALSVVMMMMMFT